MRVLGISCFYHDAAAALLVDGELVAAAEEERFSRVKHDYEYPALAIDFCLKRAGLTAQDLDLVVFYEKPFQKLDRILMSALQTFPRSLGAFREGMLVWLLDKLWVRDVIHERLGCDRKKIVFAPHHMSHAASAYYCSPFDRSAVLTVDGVGEWATGTRGTAWDTTIDLQEKMSYPHSVGLLYSAFTAFLGFQVNEGEYKVMGLAPYGQPRFVDLILDKLVDLHEDGSFWLDMSYLAYHYSATHSYNDRFCELFGRPRTPEESNLLDSHYADIAASIQKVTEEILVRQARHLQRRTDHRNLVMAGGVALNSVANARILRESGFERLYIQPAAGDGGGALGAALWGYHTVLGQPRRFQMRHAYWGQEHDEAAVADFLRSQGHDYVEMDDDDRVMDEVVERLANGQVVGWMQGRFEWGPRALGNRSILADPRSAHMKDVVNARIKFREPFRPFAPSVMAEAVEDYFVLPDAMNVDPARYMLLVVPVREEKRDSLQAITHVDGTARIQSVHAPESPRYHRLIQRFGERTGVPVVLNTSFNLRGEPIVNTPAEAYSTYARSDMDALVMGRFVVSRRKAGEGRLVPGADLAKWSHAPTRAEDRPLQPYVPPRPPVLQRLKGFAGTAATVVLVCLLAGELFLRWFVPNVNMQVGGMYRELDGVVQLTPGWSGRVHTREFDAGIQIDDRGMRDPKPVEPGRKHVVVLGDSFAFGCWSDQDRTWLSRVQGILGHRAQVVRAGQPNAGTDLSLDILKRRGDALQPDAIVLAFYNGNDFVDNYVGKDAYRVDGGYLVMKEAPARHLSEYDCLSGRADGTAPLARSQASVGGFVRHTRVYQFVAGVWTVLTQPRGTVRLNEPGAWCLKSYTAEMDQAVGRTRDYLDGLLAEAKRRGVPMVLVSIPSKVEVYDADWKSWLDFHELDETRFDRGRPTAILAQWASQRGVPFLDLRTAFVGRPRMYYERDMHWNDDGHAQAGEQLEAFLRAEGIVP